MSLYTSKNGSQYSQVWTLIFVSLSLAFTLTYAAAVAEGEIEEAKLVLTQRNNENKPLTKVRAQLEHDLADMFGGFTHTEGYGGWESSTGKLYSEPDWIYDVAVANTPENRQSLHELAVWLKDAAEQEAIYLRYPDGEVVFV